MQADVIDLEEAAFAQIDDRLAKWANPEDVVWKDQTWIDNERFAQCHALIVDGEREEVILVRFWRGEQPQTAESADLTKSFDQMKGEIDEMSFPHSGYAEEGTRAAALEEAFRDEVGGDVVFLWKYDYLGNASYVARVARVGHDEALVCGTAAQEPDGSVTAKVDFSAPLDELLPTRGHSVRR
ncbi:hypothetical protein [Rhizobium leguminosarum]|uniref:hypothetical protein n=1 Tax=Rhizobium leguminosarum TaxID=384 RepID=UPI002E0DB653|nr:hypothetical protein U8Q02_38975 [Rhizobium leguminosarum]